MSSIGSISSSSSNSVAAYQEYLARLQSQKQASAKTDTDQQKTAQSAPPSTGDVDNDGDSH